MTKLSTLTLFILLFQPVPEQGQVQGWHQAIGAAGYAPHAMQLQSSVIPDSVTAKLLTSGAPDTEAAQQPDTGNFSQDSLPRQAASTPDTEPANQPEACPVTLEPDPSAAAVSLGSNKPDTCQVILEPVQMLATGRLNPELLRRLSAGTLIPDTPHRFTAGMISPESIRTPTGGLAGQDADLQHYAGTPGQETGHRQSSGTLTLDRAQQLAAGHHPLRGQQPVHTSIRDLNLRNLNTQYLPKISVSASAQYQSDVTEIDIPLPGAVPPTQPKDRYSLSLNMNQLIWDGGRISSARDVERSYRELEQQSVEVEIYRIKEQVNEAYFNVLITRKRMESLDLQASDVQARLDQVRVRVESGAVLASQADVLEAEGIRLRQQRAGLAAAHRTAVGVLSELTGEPLPDDVDLEVPETVPVPLNGQNGRPEFRLFDLNRTALEDRERLTKSQYRPVISGFAQTAYSRPGLDIFDDSFSPWYMVGVTARWNLWNWNKSSRERQVLHLERKLVDTREQAFEQQVTVTETQYLNTISRLSDVMSMDDEIIGLRERIAEQSEQQLLNGTITATEYLAELNELHQARLSKNIHSLDLRQARINLAIHKGILP